MTIFLKDEQATLEFGQLVAKYCQPGLNIYLHGDLGAGKTTLVRGLIQFFLPEAKVKSPTYTLVEDYDVSASAKNTPLQHIHHFDLYRLADPEELEYLGGRDYFNRNALCLVEWPERGAGWLPPADLEITLTYQANARVLKLQGHTVTGALLCDKLYESYR